MLACSPPPSSSSLPPRPHSRPALRNGFPRRLTPHGAHAATSCLPSAPPRSSAAWTCARRSTRAHRPASARRRRIASSRKSSLRRYLACGSGCIKTRRSSAPTRAGTAAWRVTLPTLPTGPLMSRTTGSTKRTARFSTSMDFLARRGRGMMLRATSAACTPRCTQSSSIACVPVATPRPPFVTAIGRHWRRQ
jgi:hypothetical protein